MQSTMEPVIVQEIDQDSSEICIPTEKIYNDPYDEEESEQKFLLSKPTCFIIIGKPGSGKTTFAQRFAQYWRCEFLNPQTLLSEMLRSTENTANTLWQILSKGESISEDLVFQMLEEKIHSPEVGHHGYILDGYPTISENFMNIHDQFERMKTWKLTPDVIINLRIPDEDLLARRISQRIDPRTGIIYTEEVYTFAKRTKKETKTSEEETEEDVEAEEEESEETEELSPEILKSLLIRPEDLPEQVDESIQKYKSNMLRIMEEYIMDHDRDFIIELDANQPVELILQQIVTKLQLFGITPAAVLQRLHDEDEEEAVEEMDIEEMFKALCTKKIVSPPYPWKKSQWGKNCPVALYEGNIIPGKAEYAVSFLDKLYFLSSVEFMDRFLRNPRPYLLRPNPKLPCKISVLGLPKSGKTSLCYLLADKYKAKVVQIQDKIDEISDHRKEEELKIWMQECTQTAIETVKNNMKKKVAQEFSKKLMNEKLSNIEKEEKDSTEKTDEREKKTEEQDDPENKEVLESEPENDRKVQEDELKEAEEESLEDPKFSQTGQPEIIVEEVDVKSEKEENLALDESPLNENLSAKIDEAVAAVDANHPNVLEVIKKLMKQRGMPKVSVSAEEQFDMLYESILKIEEENQQNKDSHIQNGGWILDGVPSNTEIWQVCIERNWFPDNIIFLLDDSTDFSWSMKEWLKYQSMTNLDSANIDIESITAEMENITAEMENITAETENITAEIEPKEEINVEKSATDIIEDVEGEEGTVKDEEMQPTEVESKVLTEEEGSVEGLSNVEPKEPTQTSESPEIDPPKKVEIVEETSKSQGLSKAAIQYKDLLKERTSVLNTIVNTVTSIANLEPLTIEINDVNIEAIFEKAVVGIEKPLQHHSIEYTLNEMEEDDDLFEEEENEDEENEEIEEEEEEENIHHSRKRHLGNTSYFCPVMLKDKGILCPGKPECATKFANKLYYMSSSDALEQFLMNSSMYAPKDSPPKPPAIRLCIIGAHGSGKTVYGRYLAHKLGIFHICFHEKLQEMILKKTKKKVGPHYGDSGTTSEESEEEEEEIETEKMNVSDESSEFGELTEEEEYIKANLEGETALPLELLEIIITPWWFQEPFRSTGFILEGFPRNSDEVTAIQEFGLWFDAAIILSVDDTDVVARLLPPKLEVWRVKKEKKFEKIKKKKEKRKKDREEKMKKRREELEKELEEKKKAKQAKIKEKEETGENEPKDAKEKTAGDKENEKEDKAGELEETQPEEYIEEEEEMDIEMLLLEEFQEEEAEEELDEVEEETEEDAYDKIFGEITEQYEIEASKVTSVQESLEDSAIPRIIVEAGRRQHIVNYVLNRSLKPYVDFRESIFERVYPVSEGIARQLLNSGYKQPSCLGCWCPVSLQENVSIQTISSGKNERYPCIYRQYIYFLSSPEARDKFIKNPLSFLKNNTKPRPLVPLKIAILGPPKSGKTYLSNKFSEKYGAERLSLGIVTRRILETQPNTHLSTKILSYLCKGLTLPDELAIEALEIVLLDVNCQTKGYIFDGFPITKHQKDLMTAREIIPVKVIVLDIDSTEVIHRGALERLNLPRPYLKHDSGQVLAIKYQVFQREITSVVESYEEKHQNLHKINGKQSRWALWEEVKNIALDNIWKIQKYLLNTKEGKAASLSGMCVTYNECINNLGDFNQFCPVSLALNGELVDCSKDFSMDLVTEFRGHYYKMATKENLQLFLDEPEKFVPPNAPYTLPPAELLPSRFLAQDDYIQYELKGYCPVTFLDGKCRYEAIIPGKRSLVAKYKNKFYMFASEEQLDKFMRLPEKYSYLELPHKLPPQINPMEILQLPNLGYMEQTVATPLLRALVAVGNFKPKYPFLNATRSALVYVAYHLKAFNIHNSDYIRKKYLQKLKRFEEDCDLIGYLSKNMSSNYINPEERSEVFNNKIETFFSLKSFEPNLAWIAR